MFEIGKTYGAFDDFTIAIRQLLLPLLDGFWPILCNECAAAWRFSSVSSHYIIFLQKPFCFTFWSSDGGNVAPNSDQRITES